MEKGVQRMKMKVIPKEELEKLIKSGKAKQVHLIGCGRTLKPRGSLKKESIGLTILERLLTNFEHWTNPKYSDNPDVGTLLSYLKSNLDSEVSAAWNEFLKMSNSNKSEEEMWKDFWERRDGKTN
jgi:hypothetical protein